MSSVQRESGIVCDITLRPIAVEGTAGRGRHYENRKPRNSLNQNYQNDQNYQYSFIHSAKFLKYLLSWQWSGKKVKVLVAQLCPNLCNPMDCGPQGSSVCGIFQARVLEWVAVPFSRGSSQSRDQTLVSCVADGLFTAETTREAWHVIVNRREGCEE